MFTILTIVRHTRPEQSMTAAKREYCPSRSSRPLSAPNVKSGWSAGALSIMAIAPPPKTSPNTKVASMA